MNKKLVYIFIFVSLIFCSSLSGAATNKTILPLTFGSGFQKPNVSMSVNVNIEGENIPLIFDSGCGTALKLSENIIKKFKIKYITTKQKKCGISPLGKQCSQIVIIPKIKLGGFIVHNVKAEIFTKQWAGEKYWNYKNFKDVALKNGVVGLPVIKKFNALIDFKNNHVVLYKKSFTHNLDLKKWVKIPFSMKYGFIGTKATVDGISLRLVWDTAFIPSQIKATGNLKDKITPCKKTYALMAKDLVCLQTKFFISSGVKIPNTVFLYKDLGLPKFIPIDGFVGTNFFFNNTVFFDFKNHFIYIKVN